jgi:hypothetical protein
MATRQEILDLLKMQAEIQQQVMSALMTGMPGDANAVEYGTAFLTEFKEAVTTALSDDGVPAPSDDGDAARAGLGEEAAPTLGMVYTPPEVRPYDEKVVSARLYAIADLCGYELAEETDARGRVTFVVRARQ